MPSESENVRSRLTQMQAVQSENISEFILKKPQLKQQLKQEEATLNKDGTSFKSVS
jgi:hypothetical protein